MVPSNDSLVAVSDLIYTCLTGFDGKVVDVHMFPQRLKSTESKEFVTVDAYFKPFILNHGELRFIRPLVKVLDVRVELRVAQEVATVVQHLD